MAKRVNEQDVSPDKGGMRILYVELSGSNATLQEGLRTLITAMHKPAQVGTPAPRRMLANETPVVIAAQDPEPDLFNQQPDVAEAEVILQAEQPEADSNGTTTPRVTRGARRGRKTTGIPDLDFNSAKPTFREFAAEKKPTDQFDWYLLVASWMKTHKQTEEIGTSHIITASQYIGSDWSLPEDIGQPFRDGRRRDTGIFVKGSKNGVSKISSVGEDRVTRMGTASQT